MSGNSSAKQSKVVGIQFAEDTLVPIVMLKASGEQAAQLLSQAKSADNKPVISSPELAAQLYRIPMDQAVTPDLFPLMAALLAHVIQVDKNLQSKMREAS
ncbi:MAG: EscU/YscU/HrcU family type III secretion system export apparatus switch protein [Steroidobacter sp.]